MSEIRHPQRIHSVHVESIDGELCVYDTVRQRVHALNHAAAFVWQRCDGGTAPAEIAAALSAEMSIDDAEAVVRLTLQELADAQLLAAPIQGARVSRRDLLRRGVAAAAIPAIYSIVAPGPAAAQSAPPSGTITFSFTGADETFVVPAGVVTITILAAGAQGGIGFGTIAGTGGLGGRTTATVSVTPDASLTVTVGGTSLLGVGGFNGGGGSTGLGGGGGGASSVRDGATPLVIAGGGGGGGAEAGGGAIVAGGNGGAGGDLIADPGGSPSQGGGGGGGGTQAAGGTGGARSSLSGTDGTAGVADQGGIGGNHQLGVIGGGGGGGGYFGGGGGGGGNPSTAGAGGGGGGSSFTAPGATAVLHEQGVKASNGFVTISW